MHPGVLEAGAIGVPDERSGEAVKVVVVRKDPALTEAECAGALQAAPDRLQDAAHRRVPQRAAAQDQHRQDPAPRTARRPRWPRPATPHRAARPRCRAARRRRPIARAALRLRDGREVTLRADRASPTRRRSRAGLRAAVAGVALQPLHAAQEAPQRRGAATAACTRGRGGTSSSWPRRPKDGGYRHRRRRAVRACRQKASARPANSPITMAEDWRGSGLAARLLASLMRRARRDGYATMEGWVLAENTPMLGAGAQARVQPPSRRPATPPSCACGARCSATARGPARPPRPCARRGCGRCA